MVARAEPISVYAPTPAEIQSSVGTSWKAIVVRGALAMLFGVLTLALPGISVAALVILFGAYALADGVTNLVGAVRGRRADTRPRWVMVMTGVVGIGAGVVTLLMPGVTALALVYYIGAWAVVTGVLEVVAAVRLRRVIRGEWLLAASGILSVVFGTLIMLYPGPGALALVLWIGAYALVMGGFLVALGVRVRSLMHPHETPAGGAMAH